MSKGFRGRMVGIGHRGRGLGTLMNRLMNDVGFGIGLKRNWKYLLYFPEEVLWSPFWKLWHYCWRKRKGYL